MDRDSAREAQLAAYERELDAAHEDMAPMPGHSAAMADLRRKAADKTRTEAERQAELESWLEDARGFVRRLEIASGSPSPMTIRVRRAMALLGHPYRSEGHP